MATDPTYPTSPRILDMDDQQIVLELWADVLAVMHDGCYLPPKSAGQLLTVSQEISEMVRRIWRVKLITFTAGTNIAIWVEVDGKGTYPKWKSGVIIATGSLKFSKYIPQGNLELLWMTTVANHTDAETLRCYYSPLMHNPDVKKRLTCY